MFSQIVIGTEGRFHVSYLERTGNDSGNVRYATREGASGAWDITQVGLREGLTFGFVGARNSTSVALDSRGNPWVAYGDGETVRLARWDGAAWQSSTVVEAGRRPLGQLVSLKLDAADQPHVAYFEVTSSQPLDGIVKYARGTFDG